jgi:hypothetical protein
METADATPYVTAKVGLWGASMPEYQVHVLDEWGCIVRTVKVECDGDEQARVLAEDPTGRISTELWQGDRLIGRYDCLWTDHSPAGDPGQPRPQSRRTGFRPGLPPDNGGTGYPQVERKSNGSGTAYRLLSLGSLLDRWRLTGPEVRAADGA